MEKLNFNEIIMSKYLKILTEEKGRILNLHKKRFLYELNPNKWGKPLNEQVEIKRPDGDPFAYMKSGDTYYHINVGKEDKSTPSETDSRWQEETRPKAIEAIKTQIFADSSTTTTGTDTTPENTADLSSQVSKITTDTKWNNFPCVPLSFNSTKDKKREAKDTKNYINVMFSIDGNVFFNGGVYCKDTGSNTHCFDTSPIGGMKDLSQKFKCNGKDIVKS